MEEGNTQQQSEQRSQLLQEGARSYVDAVTAVLEFRREVRIACERVLRKHLHQYGQALTADLSNWKIEPWLTPENEWDGRFAEVGVRLIGVPVLKERYGDLYLELRWEGGEPESTWFGACAVMEFSRKKDCDELAQFLGNPKPATPFSWENDGWYWWLSLPLSPEDLNVLERKLEELFEQWIQIWDRLRIKHPASVVAAKKPQPS